MVESRKNGHCLMSKFQSKLVNPNVSSKVIDQRVKLKVILGAQGDVRQFTEHEERIPSSLPI